jgi:membrane fusion protein, adhesin transport system
MDPHHTISEQQAWKQCAEERRLLAFRTLKTPKAVVQTAVWLVILFFVVFVALGFVPWQQTVNGVGEVTVLSPMSRPQELKSSVPGRIKTWFVKEGDWVKQGDPLVELQEIKISYLDSELIDRLKQKQLAYQAKQAALKQEIAALGAEQSAIQSGRGYAVPAAQRKRSEVDQKIMAASRKVEGARQAYETARLNLDRRTKLWQEGLRSRRDYELAQQDEAKQLADLQSREAQVLALQQTAAGAGLEVGKTNADFMAKQAGLSGDIAKAEQSLASIKADMQDIEIKIANQQARQEQLFVKAPVSGRMVRARAVGPGIIVKEGESLGVIMPETTDRVAALYINDFNTPLIQPGQKVRLQFSGWPALQFSGFPQASMGTFAGVVKIVDAISDESSSQFRILVEADTDVIQKGEQPWPAASLLRPGTQVSGWVMLRTVPLGYELWRRFNGFPPSLRDSTKAKKSLDSNIKSKAVKGAK